MNSPALTLIVIAATAASAFSQTSAEWLVKADGFERKGQTREAMDAYLAADKIQPGQAKILVKIAKQYGDLMTETRDQKLRKKLAEQSLQYSRQALKADPNFADAHLSVAISVGKLVEFGGNRQKVESSREIKSEADQALLLDPKSDYAHHMLGRWHQELAGMGTATRAIAKMIYGGLPAASYAEALKHFDEARKLRKDRLIHQIEYGRTLAMMGRDKEAKTELQLGLAMPNRDKDDEESKQRGRASLNDL